MGNKKILFLGDGKTSVPFHSLDKLGPIITPVLESSGFDVTESRALDMLQKENIFTYIVNIGYLGIRTPKGAQ